MVGSGGGGEGRGWVQRPSPGQGQEKLDEAERPRPPLLSPTPCRLLQGWTACPPGPYSSKTLWVSPAESFSLSTG